MLQFVTTALVQRALTWVNFNRQRIIVNKPWTYRKRNWVQIMLILQFVTTTLVQRALTWVNFNRQRIIINKHWKFRKTQLDPNHVDVAVCYHSLGAACFNMGEFQQAKYYHQQALEIRKTQLDPNHVDVAVCYHSLGAACFNMGEFQQAKDYYQQALKIQKKELGPNHVDVATNYYWLAEVYAKMKKFQQAKDYHQQALEIRKTQLDPNHVDVATSYYLLADVCFKMEEFQQAKDYHQQALEIRKAQLGPNHVDAATCYNTLPEVYQKKGSLEQAKNCNQKKKNPNQDTGQKAQIMSSGPSATENKKQGIAPLKFQSLKSVSVKHKEKFEQLLESCKSEPETKRIISCNSVCFSEQFSIGRGSYGTEVYICLGSDGMERAIKRLPKWLCQKFLRNERDILTSPNVVQSPRIVNYWFYDDTSSHDFGYLILDLHERNLEEYVKEEGDKISKSDARRMICQVLKGLRALHTREPRILHRDLKPTNILVDVNGDLVLSDFGIGRFFCEQGTKIFIEVFQLLIY